LGIATGAVAGLVAITPASGTAGPMGAIAIGFAGAFFAWIASTKVKRALGYDDSLDVWGVHGVAGIVGAILTGVFAAPALGGAGLGDGVDSIGIQVIIQTVSVVAVLIYGGLVSLLILLVVKATVGLRVTEEQETEGLDLALHDERGYII
jgi:Amt family ammonium transporter